MAIPFAQEMVELRELDTARVMLRQTQAMTQMKQVLPPHSAVAFLALRRQDSIRSLLHA